MYFIKYLLSEMVVGIFLYMHKKISHVTVGEIFIDLLLHKIFFLLYSSIILSLAIRNATIGITIGSISIS